MLKQWKQTTYISAAASLLFGVLLLCFPGTMQDLIGYLLGAAIILYGVVRTVLYFRTEAGSFIGYDLASGLCLLTAGICILIWHNQVVELLTILLGAIVIISGIVDLQRAADLYRLKYERWWIMLIIGLVLMAFGIIILCLSAQAFIFSLIGAALVLDAVFQVFSTVFMSRVVKKLKENSEMIEVTVDDPQA